LVGRQDQKDHYQQNGHCQQASFHTAIRGQEPAGEPVVLLIVDRHRPSELHQGAPGRSLDESQCERDVDGCDDSDEAENHLIRGPDAAH